jgi:hypothetical protein
MIAWRRWSVPGPLKSPGEEDGLSFPRLGPFLLGKEKPAGEDGYRAGTSPNWVKVKNPTHPAKTRVGKAFS